MAQQPYPLHMYLLHIFVSLFSSIRAASLGFGPFEVGSCPEVTVKSPLEMEKYLGKWVEVARFPQVTSPLVGSGSGPDLECVTAWYDNENTGVVYRVTNTGLKTDTFEQFTITGKREKTS